MSTEVYRYQFTEGVVIEEVESSLLLAIMATESLHGEAQVRLDAAHYLDTTSRELVIDARTRVGCDLNRLFTGYAAREFGQDAFQVERSEKQLSGPANGSKG